VTDVVIAGAGMAGLAAAAQVRSRGASCVVYERGPAAGGSMLLSSGVVWRYGELERYRRECPAGDERLQRLLHERLDADLAWLEGLGAPVLWHATGNPSTVGKRFDTQALTDLLVREAGDVRLEQGLDELPDGVPAILATGGFAASPELVREHVTEQAAELRLRCNPHSRGDGLRLGLAAGGRLSDGMDEFYGRNVPAPPAALPPADFRRLQQLYARFARRVRNARGETYTPRTWSEIDVVQWTARQPGARAWYEVDDAALDEHVRDVSVREMVEAAATAGGPVERRDGLTTVEVVPGITSTLGGLRVDEHGRVADGLFAAGTDVGGFSTGGYASGLAAALVLGRIAADRALGID
jgi:succinate dehydrogenase/fumarate reductase flavoprotein subunit